MNTNRHTLQLYWAQARNYKLSFFTALICIPFGFLLIDTALPYFFSQTIGSLAESDPEKTWQSLVYAGMVGVGGVIANFVGFRALTRHEAHVRVALSDTTFQQLIQKDMHFFVNEKVGALTSRYIDFIRAHVNLQDLLIIRTLGFVLSVSVGLVIVAAQSWALAILIVGLLSVLMLQVRWSIKKRAPWRHARKKLAGEIHGNVADSVTNNLVVKTFAGESREIETISAQNKEFKRLFIKDIGFLATEGSIRTAVMISVQVLAIGFSAYLVLQGQMALATAIFTLTYLQRISTQIFSLGDILNGYDQALLEAAPMSDILSKANTVSDGADARRLSIVEPQITFSDVSYRYGDASHDVIKSMDLTIPAGQKVGLVGHSGAGKTTVTHLLLRFADPTSGAIEIDGHDIRDATQESLRQSIAYVPQEPLLFHRSLRENIAYGNQQASDEQIIRAAKQAHALEFIDSLPEGMDTLVGERGIKLSGGQRQRIAIARAILKDAPILVLDEATSALDSESERLIQVALHKLMKNRTSIVIAHRLSTIAKLDRIIVMKDGQIIEDGSHEELIAKKGTYAMLWSHQSGGFIED